MLKKWWKIGCQNQIEKGIKELFIVDYNHFHLNRCDSKYTDEEIEKIFLAELAAAKIKCAKISIKMACTAYTQGRV